MSFDLEEKMVSLLVLEPFWSYVCMHIAKKATKAIPTAGVGGDDEGRIVLYYNPDFMEMLYSDNKKDDARAVIIHELEHCVLGHLGIRKNIGGETNNRIKNVAFDLAINSGKEAFKTFHERYVTDSKGNQRRRRSDDLIWDVPYGDEAGKQAMPETHVRPLHLCVPTVAWFKDYPEGLSAEQYLELLRKDKRKCEADSFDDHNQWENADEDMDNVAQERLKDVVRDATRQAQSTNQWGNVSAAMRDEIIKWVNGTIDWRKVLRYFIQGCIKADKKASLRHINKRYPYIHSGRKVTRTANIAISIDQSGSVSDELLGRFYGELASLSKLATFTVIPFDCQVFEEKIHVWKKGVKMEAKRYLTGGTNFNAPTKWVNEKGGFQGHIILTDMGASKPSESKCQRLWLTDEAGAKTAPFKTNERILVMK
jgi:predicted metal-dependent peptidase